MTTPPGNPYQGDAYPPPPGGGYGSPQQESSTPKTLGIIGIICAFVCSPAGIVLGLIGQSKAREYGQSDTLPKVAWILSACLLALSILSSIVRYTS